jgi:cold shock CspA family protein
MTSLVKSIIISLVVGSAGYFISLTISSNEWNGTPADIGALLVVIIAVLAGTLLSGSPSEPASASSTSSQSTSSQSPSSRGTSSKGASRGTDSESSSSRASSSRAASSRATSSEGAPAEGTTSSAGTASSAATTVDLDDPDREHGEVKWFNVKKGYGFITRDSGDDVFVHYRNIVGEGRRSIAEGQSVTYIVIDGDKGLQADEVVGD